MKQELKKDTVDLELGQVPYYQPNESNKIKKKKKCAICKRILLILTLLPFLAFIPSLKYDWCRSLYYILPISGIVVYVFLLNFPMIVTSIHTRPIYYDDLEDSRYIDQTIKKRFQFIFIVILQITVTLIISSMIYYYYDQFHYTELSKIEIFGVLGGFISLLLKIENMIGNSVLVGLNLWKNRSPISVGNDLKKTRQRSSTFAMTAIV
jgi:hypothetical protein